MLTNLFSVTWKIAGDHISLCFLENLLKGVKEKALINCLTSIKEEQIILCRLWNSEPDLSCSLN